MTSHLLAILAAIVLLSATSDAFHIPNPFHAADPMPMIPHVAPEAYGPMDRTMPPPFYAPHAFPDMTRTVAYPSVYFLVVAGNSVVGHYTNIEDAKRKLYHWHSEASHPSRLVAEVRCGVVQKDPHTCGGQNQGGGVNAGFNKWWSGWSDIHRMIAIAQGYASQQGNACHGGSGYGHGHNTYFLVVAYPHVVGKYTNIEDAKRKLLDYHRGAQHPSRLVAEVRYGVVQKDPHTCGGQNQGGGLHAGFNKFWWDWWDINRMIAIAQGYVNTH